MHLPDDALIAAASDWVRAALVPDPAEPGAWADAPSGSVLTWNGRTGRAPAGPFTICRERDVAAIRQARRTLEQAIAVSPGSRFLRFADAFGLNQFEFDVLLLLFFHATHLGVADLCAVRSECDHGWPTFALALRLAQDPEWDTWPPERQAKQARSAAEPDWRAVSPEGPLRVWRLVEITQPGGMPLISSALRLDERIVNHLKGADYLDERIAAFCPLIPFTDNPVSETQRAALDEADERMHRTVEGSRNVIVQLPGADRPTRRLFAAHLAASVGASLHRSTADEVLRLGQLHDFTRLWNREGRLQPIVLDLDASEAAAETRTEIARVLEGLDGVIALEISDPLPDLDGSLLVDVARPTVSEQRSRWIESLGEASTALADRIVGQFDLSLRDIDQVVWVAGESSDAEALWRELRARGRARLEGLAQRIAPTATLEEVELPAEAKQLLTRIRDQARRRSTVYDEYGFRSKLARGLGIAVLFEGESGTGKTMAAEALANALELDLYRVDLASVVSKYIGETEKNLKRVFDAAEASSAILLFDEADAIFGKRSEVKDSHDRYANIEVGYLLQRMEAYEGLAILTTNLKSALDQAFLRRLRFIVNFPFPGRDQRRRIWARIFPALPKGGLQGIAKLDFDALAGPSLTGGQIRNIAVGGAFLAASDGGVIVMEHLRDAACDELRKNGRPFVASDFAGWVTPVRSHCDPRLVEEGAR